jgi:dienelactone hydrolase
MSCPDCFSGNVHEGSPKGQITTLHGLDAYVSEPAEGTPVKGLIIIIPDAFGWEFVNNRILADHYAEKGSYKVYLPDFMKGELSNLRRSRNMDILHSFRGMDWGLCSDLPNREGCTGVDASSDSKAHGG